MCVGGEEFGGVGGMRQGRRVWGGELTDVPLKSSQEPLEEEGSSGLE